MGYVGSGLTPRVQKRPLHSRFPALISVGGANRFLEDLSPNVPRNQFFGKVVEAKVVQHVKLDWFLVFRTSRTIWAKPRAIDSQE